MKNRIGSALLFLVFVGLLWVSGKWWAAYFGLVAICMLVYGVWIIVTGKGIDSSRSFTVFGTIFDIGSDNSDSGDGGGDGGGGCGGD